MHTTRTFVVGIVRKVLLFLFPTSFLGTNLLGGLTLLVRSKIET